MTAHNVDVKSHSKKYIKVYLALMVLTVLTVYASYLPTNVGVGIILALIIASVKSTLVAGVFMHLFGEKKIIIWTLILTIIFFIFLILIPLFSSLDSIKY
ncbi:MAG: hypothetical protein EXR24_00440 [Ignavibacteria bacterium]|nr:hypothetical protein [Ignavibacteria bacterium]